MRPMTWRDISGYLKKAPDSELDTPVRIEWKVDAASRIHFSINLQGVLVGNQNFPNSGRNTVLKKEKS